MGDGMFAFSYSARASSCPTSISAAKEMGRELLRSTGNRYVNCGVILRRDSGSLTAAASHGDAKALGLESLGLVKRHRLQGC